MLKLDENRFEIAVIGLGYIGLPLALMLSKSFNTTAFEFSKDNIIELRNGIDISGESLEEELRATNLIFTDDLNDISKCNFYIVCMPTPTNNQKIPDLSLLMMACEAISKIIKIGDIIIFESTVYPGVTEEVCGKLVESKSGLRCGIDFSLAYAPERINPGESIHSISSVIKVVSAQDNNTLEKVTNIYKKVYDNRIFKAASIRVAEAAKVIENTQRDVNIALVNEFAIIFDLIGISTNDVLNAAATKWNFLKFYPGLVGGHTVGVDSYYLSTKARQLKYHPQVIQAGRRINDGMGSFIALKLIKLMINAGIDIKNARVGILGLAYKENVSDLENSKVFDIIDMLDQYGISMLVCDPHVNKNRVYDICGIEVSLFDKMKNLDAIILSVCHDEFLIPEIYNYNKMLNYNSVFIDVKSAISKSELPQNTIYWSL